mmetsp:Transcript_46799/g.146730  ORF Transcript_46799/g.146730 Transcript_46799/m.146730 type:complete len:263 (-) Transcript_46799:1019-1807(-)
MRDDMDVYSLLPRRLGDRRSHKRHGWLRSCSSVSGKASKAIDRLQKSLCTSLLPRRLLLHSLRPLQQRQGFLFLQRQLVDGSCSGSVGEDFLFEQVLLPLLHLRTLLLCSVGLGSRFLHLCSALLHLLLQGAYLSFQRLRLPLGLGHRQARLLSRHPYRLLPSSGCVHRLLSSHHHPLQVCLGLCQFPAIKLLLCCRFLRIQLGVYDLFFLVNESSSAILVGLFRSLRLLCSLLGILLSLIGHRHLHLCRHGSFHELRLGPR